MSNMIVDDFLLAMIIAGLALAGAYLRAEYALHLRSKTAGRTKERALYDLHAARVRLEWNEIPTHSRTARTPNQPQRFRPMSFLMRATRLGREHRVN
jgi:hypothetical protein